MWACLFVDNLAVVTNPIETWRRDRQRPTKPTGDACHTMRTAADPRRPDARPVQSWPPLARLIAARRPKGRPLVVQILRLVPADRPVRQPESTRRCPLRSAR